MNILKTGIIDPVSDALWEDVSPLVGDAAPRPVLILVQAYNDGSTESTQLQKMLDACGLKPEQYNTIQIAENEQAGWRMISEKLNPKIIFLIGIIPAQLGISALFRAHEPNNFNERVWLPTLSLSELEKQPAIKKQLWTNGMKPIFIDKQFGGFAD